MGGFYMKFIKAEALINGGNKVNTWVNLDNVMAYTEGINRIELVDGSYTQLSNESALEFKWLLERGEL